jgi:S-DNA-T family DNA segregation ATPase FtsK/SpoIIIE
MALGKDVAGNVLIADLAKAPHLLVAGATGSGKSVCLNTIITGFLMSRAPEQLRLILVDPKRVEFATYNGLPQLLVPVINDSRKVSFILRWAIVEMERRYKLLQKHKCRNIVGYNNRPVETQGDLFGGTDAQGEEGDPKKLPYIVIIIDEVADIMAEVGKDIEMPISRLCAKSRAVGIHLLLATQRPSVDVITGTIKSNIPGRIAFKVSQGNDSRTILDSPGAEDLLGRGDMLFLKEGSVLMRAQGAYLDDQEIERVVDFVKKHCNPCYDTALRTRIDSIRESDDEESLMNDEESGSSSASGSQGGGDDDGDEEIIRKALEVIRTTNRASISYLQRRLRIGYNKAASIIETLEERKILGPSSGLGPRPILVDLDALLDGAQQGEGADAEAMPPQDDQETIAASAIPPPQNDIVE